MNDDAQSQLLEVLWDRELNAQIVTGEDWDSIAYRGFDPPQRFAAYMNTMRWNCVTSADPNLRHSPFRAGMRPDPYQFERSNLRVRVFLDVQRSRGDMSAASELVGRFAHRFRTKQCPPDRPLREVYCDPKVSDGQRAFLPSLVAGHRDHDKRQKQISHGLGRP